MKTRIFALMATTALLFPLVHAHAVDNLTTPSGENVTAGSATFDRPAAGQLNINQSSQRVIIDWNNFDIGKNAKTEFFQPNSNALAVNRVTGAGNDPTQILGTLRANGNIIVLDRDGVLFGKDSRVDVNGIIASTGDVTNEDVINGGKLEIFNVQEGTVENQGRITVADAGLAAFVAPTVKNSGIISARMSRVSLASGSQATVDFYGDNLIELAVDSETEHALVENTGAILAEGGRVSMNTRIAQNVVDNMINMDGIVDVSSVTQQGGKIILSGAKDAIVHGKLKANSQVAGGRISIDSGDITVKDTALIEANSSFDGPAGRVDLNAKNSINAQGKIRTNGEEDGGRINITAGDNINLDGHLEARATGIGTGGRISISNGGDEIRLAGKINASGIDRGGFVRVTAANNFTMTDEAGITAKSLSTGRGGRVNLTANNDITTDGYINIDGQQGGGRLYVSNWGDLNVKGNISGKSGIIGRGGRALLLGHGATQVDGRINVNGTSGGGIIIVDGNTVNLTANSVLHARGLESALPEVTSNPGGNLAFFAPEGITAAGRINIDGFNGSGGTIYMANDHADISGKISARALNSGTGGTIRVNVDDAIISSHINTSGIDGGGLVRLADGNVTITDTGAIYNDAITNGNGGHVLLKGATSNILDGRITSRGGSASGNGGYVGINKPNTLGAASFVNVSASNGNDGIFNY